MTLILLYDSLSRRLIRKRYPKNPGWIIKFVYKSSPKLLIEELKFNIDRMKDLIGVSEEDLIDRIKSTVSEFDKCSEKAWQHEDYYKIVLDCLNKLVSDILKTDRRVRLMANYSLILIGNAEKEINIVERSEILDYEIRV